MLILNVSLSRAKWIIVRRWGYLRIRLPDHRHKPPCYNILAEILRGQYISMDQNAAAAARYRNVKIKAKANLFTLKLILIIYGNPLEYNLSGAV
jgi:hypothetical protein